MSNPLNRLNELALAQHGAFSRCQAHEAGWSDRQLAHRVKIGMLVKVGPNAFRFAAVPRSTRGDLRALLLDIGSPVWVAGPSAAALYGLQRLDPDDVVHVMIPQPRNVRRDEVEIHRTICLDAVDFRERDGFPITSPARTLIDFSRMVDYPALLHAVGNAFQYRLLQPSTLMGRMARLRSPYVFDIDKLEAVLDELRAMGPTESWLEREFLRLVKLYGLPRPRTQVKLGNVDGRGVRVDCYFEEANVVVELMGAEFHRTADQLERDPKRANALMLDGKRLLQFGYQAVTSAPDEVMREVAQAIGAKLLPSSAA